MITDRDILEAALIGYQTKSAQIEAKIAQIRSQLSGASQPAKKPAQSAAKTSTTTAAPASAPAVTKKRTMSATARKRIAVAQKKRWADYHKRQGK